MKRTLFSLLSFTAILLLLINCQTETKSNRIPFFEKEKIAITVPVKFNDTLTGRFLFDTGASYGGLILDSTFCANNNFPYWNEEPDKIIYSQFVAWAPPESTSHRIALYKKPITLDICNISLPYNSAVVQNQQLGYVEQLQGTISFPKNDSTHIWELNFENNYLEIHQASNFVRPQGCYWLDLIYDNKLWNNTAHVQFPINVMSADGDTTTISYPFLIDTGLHREFVLFPSAKEFDFFNKRDDAILINNPFGGYLSRYDVSATVFENFRIDTMRIYTDEVAIDLGKIEQGVIGLDFLKRFNVFFDFAKGKLGLQPIKNYSRIIDNNSRRFFFSLNTTADGRQFVSMMPENVKNNYYKDAGLRYGDEIIAINGFMVKDMTPESATKIRTSSKREMDILRNGKPLKIIVNIDEKLMKED